MYKMKPFLARLWVSFHYEGFVHANFSDPDERLQQDVPKTTCHWGAAPGPASLRCMTGGLCQQARPAQLFPLAAVPRGTLFIKLAQPLFRQYSSSYR